MSLSESDEHADTRSMEIEVNVTTLCYKCDRDAIAVGDGQRPLCPRHATIFVTAPRILDLERSLAQDEPETLSLRVEREPETEPPDTFDVIVERILARLSTLDGLIEGLRSPASRTHGRTDSIGSPAGLTETAA
jgi:hypothetical protein